MYQTKMLLVAEITPLTHVETKIMQHNTNRTASHKPTLFGSVDICMASYVTTVHTHFAWPN